MAVAGGPSLLVTVRFHMIPCGRMPGRVIPFRRLAQPLDLAPWDSRGIPSI
jgi:hypothetical protein